MEAFSNQSTPQPAQENELSVRELQQSDVPLITKYWLGSEPAFLEGMGVDLNKLPTAAAWAEMLQEQLRQPLEKKSSYCLIWQVNGAAVGHSNINKIEPGVAAYMHLHLWQNATRQKGLGSALVQLSLPRFFGAYRLKTLYSEPYALNPAPNKTLAKAGFVLVKSYTTTPGWINFEQPVNLWSMTYEDYLKGK